MDFVLEGAKAVKHGKATTVNDLWRDSFSLKSRNIIGNKGQISIKGGGYKNGYKYNGSTIVPPEVRKEKIIAILIMLSLLVPPFLYIFVFPKDELDSSIEDGDLEDSNLVPIPDDTITFTAKERLNERKIPEIRGTRGYSGTSQPIGDWTITGNAAVWNETITLTGDLTITSTGNLTLINVTLKMNCSYNGEYHIEVQGGGGLFIYDYDWDRFTEDDTSNITAVNANYKYLFWVQKNSKFEMRNSKLSWCGYEWGTDGDHSGLWINTDYVTIQGNLIKDIFNGIIVNGGNHTIIENNIIENCIEDKMKETGLDIDFIGIFLSFNKKSIINNNTLNNILGRNGKSGSDVKPGGAVIGIFLNQSFDNIIYDNKISHLKGGNGGSISGWDKTGQYGGLSNGIYIYQSGNSSFINNTISNCEGGVGGSAIDYRSHGGAGGYFNGIYIDQSENLTFYYNNIMDNKGGHGGEGDDRGGRGGICNGINIDLSWNLTIKNNIINNNIGGKGGYADNNGELGGLFNGIYIVQSRNSSFINNTISNCKGGDGGDAYLYAGQGGSCNGIYNHQSEYLSFHNVVILNNNYGNGGSGVHGADGGVSIGVNSFQSRYSIFEKIFISNNFIIIHKGILLLESLNNDLIKCNSSNSINGLQIDGLSSNNNIIDCIIHNNRDYGILISNSPSNKIFNTTVLNNKDYGIYISSSPNNIIENSSITSTNNYDGIFFHTSPNNIINDTSIVNNNRRGIWFFRSENNIINKCNLSNNQIGILFDTLSSNNNITNCTLYKNHDYGINFVNSPNNYIIESNIIDNNGYAGIRTYRSSYTNIIDCAIMNNRNYGIRFQKSNENKVINTTIVNHSIISIYFEEESSYNEIINCHISDSGWDGIRGLEYSYNNTIINSTILNSGNYDLYLYTDSHLITLNTTFNENKVYFTDSKSTVTVKWYLHTKVTIYDTPVKNAIVRIRDNDNGTYDNNFKTDNKGFVRCIPLIEYIQNSAQKTYFTFHQIEGVIDSYAGNVTAWMDRTKMVVILLDNSTENLLNIINLKKGWNLISLPLIQSNTDLVTILQPIIGKFNIVSYYNASDINDPWKHYHVAKPSEMNDLNSLDHKKGFLIHITANGNTSLMVTGNKPVTPQTIELYPGWNLVGFPSIVHRPVEEALNNLQFGSDVDDIQYFDSSSNKYINLEPGDYMMKGLGYWFHVDSQMTWIVNSSILPVYNLNKDIQYSTIQKAIDNANPYDTIEISEGIYYENINLNKTLNLVGKGVNSTFINGNGGGCFNISSNDIYLINLALQNCSYGMNIWNSSDYHIKNILIENASFNGIYIENSYTIMITNLTMKNNLHGITAFNSQDILVIDSTIFNQLLSSLLLEKSNISLLNVNLNTTKIQFLDSESNLIIQWYMKGIVKDQNGEPIGGSTVRIADNENGSYDQNYTSDFNGLISSIITERIQNQTGNLSFTPYNISITDSNYCFYDVPRNIIINKSTTMVITSVNTVSPTSIYNVDRDRYYLTVQEAIDDAKPYDIIQVSSGIYLENIEIHKSLTLMGEDMYSTIMSGSGERSINITSDDVVISNFYIQNCSYGIYSDINNSITISNIFISNSTYGVYINNSLSTTISNLIIQNSTYGIYLESSNGIAFSNILVSNTTYGIHINDSLSTTISNLNIQNSTYGIFLESCGIITISNTGVSNVTYGIYINNSSPTIDGSFIENNDFGILSFNSSQVNIINSTFLNENLDFSISDSNIISLNAHFNVKKVTFFDPFSNLTVKWYLHVRVEDAINGSLESANVWIVDNENGTFDQNFTTGSDGYIWFIILTERIQNQSGNISFNPYWINVSYYDSEYGYGWLTFQNNPRNVSVNGSLFEIRKETFTSLEAIPEFSHILIPIIAITTGFVLFRKKRRKIQ